MTFGDSYEFVVPFVYFDICTFAAAFAVAFRRIENASESVTTVTGIAVKRMRDWSAITF